MTLEEIGDLKPVEGEAELAGVRLRDTNWKGRQIDERTVEFEKTISKYNVKVVKALSIGQGD